MWHLPYMLIFFLLIGSKCIHIVQVNFYVLCWDIDAHEVEEHLYVVDWNDGQEDWLKNFTHFFWMNLLFWNIVTICSGNQFTKAFPLLAFVKVDKKVGVENF